MATVLLFRSFIQTCTGFFRREFAAGIVLLASALLALVLANTSWGPGRYFPGLWDEHLRVSLNGLTLDHTLLEWINDGLMTIFFLIVGLEIKREVLDGKLSSLRLAALPVVGAIGGMLVPVLLFTLCNYGAPTHGAWGIPMATDIAFSLAILQLLGRRVPVGLKVFLTALAIVDDLGAILVIACFYTKELHVHYLGLALGTWGVLLALNIFRVRTLWAYLPLGFLLTYFMLESGLHATLAGVLLAVAIPFRNPGSRPVLLSRLARRLTQLRDDAQANRVDPSALSEELEILGQRGSSSAHRLEHQLHALVSFGIIPLFAFANSSLVLTSAAAKGLASPLGLGIMIGLVVGKPLGVGALAWGAVRLGWAALPPDVSWRQLWGGAVLAGIGFTMSIFITMLALGHHSLQTDIAKLAVLVGSACASGLGYALLRSIPAGPPGLAASGWARRSATAAGSARPRPSPEWPAAPA